MISRNTSLIGTADTSSRRVRILTNADLIIAGLALAISFSFGCGQDDKNSGSEQGPEPSVATDIPEVTYTGPISVIVTGNEAVGTPDREISSDTENNASIEVTIPEKEAHRIRGGGLLS